MSCTRSRRSPRPSRTSSSTAPPPRRILGRLILNCGAGSFPTPHEIIRAPVDSLRAAGFSYSKVAALKDLAEKTLANVVPDGATLAVLSDDEIIERLTQVRGIGRWTVEMLLMFRLARPDVLPVDDFGVRAGFQAAYGLSSMPHPRALLAYGERWRPHRSAAAWYLWRALELKRAGTLPAPPQPTRLPRIIRRRRKSKTAKAAKRAVRKTARRTPAEEAGSRPRRAPARPPLEQRQCRARVGDAQQRLVLGRGEACRAGLALQVVTHHELVAAQFEHGKHRAPGIGPAVPDDVHGRRRARLIQVVATPIDNLVAAVNDAVGARFQQQVAHPQIRHVQRARPDARGNRHPRSLETLARAAFA